MNEKVDRVGAEIGILERGADRLHHEVSVVHPTVGTTALPPAAELIIQAALPDAEMFHHPLGLQQCAVGPGGAQVL